MIGIGLISLFYPSRALWNVWLYGGLLLFSAMVLYDTQKIIFNAKMKPYYDPINESLSIYLDSIIIFQRFLLIFMNKRQRK